MAASRAVVALFMLLAAVVAPAVLEAADDTSTTHLHFFMHDVASGSNPTSVQVIQGPGSGAAASSGLSFGDTSVMDNALTETSSSTSSEVGRMQGVYMVSSLTGAVRMVTANILLTGGDSNGSTIAVMGRDDTADAAAVRELSVIGGSGSFKMASGYVLWKTAAANGPDSTVELDVYLGSGNATIDASAPVSPVDGSGSSPSSGGSGGSGGKSSSSASRMTSSSAGKWALAVAAAVVGSWIW